jgi:hypothetical protein
MSKSEPSSYLEALDRDINRWKKDVERMKREEHLFWAERYQLNLINTIVERMRAKPQVSSPSRQRALVGREMLKGNLTRV